MRLPRRLIPRRGERRADRLTVGVAALAVGTAGTVFGSELLRLARRRARGDEQDGGMLGSAEHAIETAGLATRDTVAVTAGGYEATPRGETVLFNMLSGFLGGFALMRLSSTGIRSGWWPAGNVRVGGRHIHHFVPGILLAFGSGAFALMTANERLEKTLAIPFGAGAGMTFDEAALLLDLRDVYWTREGLLSVQLSLGVLAVLSAAILGLRMLRRGERRAESLGAIPVSPPRDPWGSVQAPRVSDPL